MLSKAHSIRASALRFPQCMGQGKSKLESNNLYLRNYACGQKGRCRMRGGKSIGLLMGLLCVGVLLTGCTMLRLAGETTAAAPNLGLLEMEPYRDAETQSQAETGDHPAYLRVDLWLDASQVMGGINPNAESIYSHSGRKFREGGFHYRYGSTVGWYENVLRDMLGAAEGSRVRLLRAGNERLSDDLILSQGLLAEDATTAQILSMRRDLLTYAIDPLPSVFEELSAEDMEGSFYALGSSKLNQMARFESDGGRELENPGLVREMSATLERQITALAQGSRSADFVMQKDREDKECPLVYVLENMDLSRLTVIPFDPAGLKRLTGTDVEGKPIAYVERLLRERGVFDQELCAGLYAFQLDYMGEMATIGPAELAEPLIWGKPIYDAKKREIDYVAPMPRTLLALVIGAEEQVDGYMGKLTQRLHGDAGLKGLRGPRDGELTYMRGDATITQQPFSFAFWETVIGRPKAGYYTQHTAGAALVLQMGEGQVVSQGLTTVMLSPTAQGKQEDRVLTLRFPLAQTEEGAKLDLTELNNAHVEVPSALLMTETLPNTKETRREAKPGEQILPLRDRLYVYGRLQDPFEKTPEASPFSLMSIGQNKEGTELICTVAVKGAKLKEGYYRVRVCADITGQEVEWLPVDWIDGSQSLSASISNEDIARWEAFAAKIAETEREKGVVPRNLQHAWGSYQERKYNGLVIPECPPVEKALGLAELARQLRDAAKVDQSPYVRYVFDVFVENTGAAAPEPPPVE